MDVSHIIDSLNDCQREAVSAEPGPLLVLAGAGSGKTRVLIHRIAWICEVIGESPYSVLAVTFTNKAAAEMRSRVESLLGISAAAMWVGTFHGLAHRMLRLHYEAAGLPQNFQILDSDDQLRMVKRVVRQLELDEGRWPPKQAQWFINHSKDGACARKISIRARIRFNKRCSKYTGFTKSCVNSPASSILPSCCYVCSS